MNRLIFRLIPAVAAYSVAFVFDVELLQVAAGAPTLEIGTPSAAALPRRRERSTRAQRRRARSSARKARRTQRRQARVARRTQRRARRGRKPGKVGSLLRKVGRAIGRGFTKLVGAFKRGWSKFLGWARRFPPIDRYLSKQGRCRLGKKVEVDYSKWRLTFRDEFNGSDGSACFTMAPQCQKDAYWGGVEDCPRETWANLRDLNKCNWYMMHYKNYMHETVNNFHPSDVTVQGGSLVLTSRARNQSRVTNGTCPVNGRWSSHCKFSAGGVESYPRGPVKGFKQRYGRWEVRARLPTGVGSWPAHWLLPADPGAVWPKDGEIDILELWGPPYTKATFNLHYTDADQHESQGAGCKVGKRRDFSNGFHLFAIEWEPGAMRWYVDDYLITTLKSTDRNKNGKLIKIPSMNFFWILNTSITRGWNYKPDAANYGVHKHYIDYVRVYTKK